MRPETQQSTKPTILELCSPDQNGTEHVRERIASWVTFSSSLPHKVGWFSQSGRSEYMHSIRCQHCLRHLLGGSLRRTNHKQMDHGMGSSKPFWASVHSSKFWQDNKINETYSSAHVVVYIQHVLHCSPVMDW
jgi:hypothetical protein